MAMATDATNEAMNTLLNAITDLTLQVKQIEIVTYPQHITRNLEDKISMFSTGDTSWMIISTIFVIMMTTPGIMLYYAGLVRLQNALATAMQGYSIACMVTFLWLCFGYSLAFSPANPPGGSAITFIGNADKLWLQGLRYDGFHDLAPTIPEAIFCTYELAFAVITPAIICGAFADRMKYISMLASIGLWHIFVYCPIAHSTWHPDGFLSRHGVLDFAGGNVVHVSSGFSALVSAIIIGKRTGFRKKANFHPHNMLVTITGE
jgi:ammonium transporter, Amt family